MNYEATAQKVLNKIEKYGGSVEIFSSSVADPIKGTVSPGVVVYSGKALFTQYDRRLVDGINIKSSDIQMLMPATPDTAKISEGFSVVTKTGQYSVVATPKVDVTGSDPLLYKVQIR